MKFLNHLEVIETDCIFLKFDSNVLVLGSRCCKLHIYLGKSHVEKSETLERKTSFDIRSERHSWNLVQKHVIVSWLFFIHRILKSFWAMTPRTNSKGAWFCMIPSVFFTSRVTLTTLQDEDKSLRFSISWAEQCFAYAA